jgi:mannose-6-phosphate isomerase class I
LNLPHSTYDRFPFVSVTQSDVDCHIGWQQIGQLLASPAAVTVVELYPGCNADEIESHLVSLLNPDVVLRSADALLTPPELEERFRHVLGDDPVFAYMQSRALEDFFCPSKLSNLRRQVQRNTRRVLVIGTGASLIAPNPDRLIYGDLARWEIQRRFRAHSVGNLGADNAHASPSLLYKRAFFLDWRSADRLKANLLDRIDFLLDSNVEDQPKLISGDHLRMGLRTAAQQPFRVVPFFDPGPWGGQWMKDAFELPAGPPNYAWCFDCVPEENSLLLGFGIRRVEIPALDLVLFCSRELLGESIIGTFGNEFPIRFDYLDTMHGGNLSLQVHPLRNYISDKFGMGYTQDESYYLLQAAEDAVVYLGLKENVDRDHMERALRCAQEDRGAAFDAQHYVNAWPAKKHDHFLIPAGTIHCSGKNSVVLEISATPYIFTFKLWDWGRLGLDGNPRPIHLDHGLANIDWKRTTSWVRNHLINQVSVVERGAHWREERTGLHELEFIETRRHWFTGIVPHNTEGTVNVLNLVEGDEAVVGSPSGAFSPFRIHYGETFIIPAQVGAYTICPCKSTTRPLATIKAFMRDAAK